MPKKAAEGGGAYLGTAGWLALGAASGIVLIRRHEQMADFAGDKGPVPQIRADVVVLSPSKRSGEFWPDQHLINTALVNKLINEDEGTAIAARVDVGKNGANKYPQANPPSEPEYKLVEEFYSEHDVDIDDDDCDARLFAKLHKIYKASMREEVREQATKATTSSGKASSKATTVEDNDDDEPPF